MNIRLFSLASAATAVMILSQGAAAQSFVWGSTDVRYDRTITPESCAAPALTAWKGERVSAQAVFSADSDRELTISASDLKCGENVIPTSCISYGFVDYVIADYFERMGENVKLQPDRIVNAESRTVPAGCNCPVWFTIKVPQGTPAGRYKGCVSASFDGKTINLPLSVTVTKRVLPVPEEWSFHLDLWQDPYAFARYFNVPLWSKEHFDAMRPIVRKYAEAGGKVITASIIRHPWNCQTYDPYESMVAKQKHLDGSWTYDYSVFDKWVEFMLSCGVTEQIDCYTVVPWGYEFEYFDIASSSVKTIACTPGEQAYEDYILPFLTDFAKHLKAKGWFDRTCIAMDERPMDQLIAARKVVQKADPGFRIQGAVNYSPEVVDIMYDISVGYAYSNLPDEVKRQRKKDNLVTTIYTCCGPDHPNTFTFSPLAESEYIPLSAAARNYGGYLRWALFSWPEDPCKDSRFGNWLSGDTYLLYPQGSSLRFERLMEGIQDFEKIRILRESGDPKILKKIDAILAPFREIVTDESINASETVAAAKAAINRL